MHRIARPTRLTALVIAAIALVTTAHAAPLNSRAGGGSCILNASTFSDTDCTLQAITPHSLWQQNNPDGSDATWVSYANTGVGGDTFAPINTGQWIMKVTETFTIGDGGGDILLKIWADDTADVYLNGALKKQGEFSQNVCAGKAIGCEPDEFWTLSEDLAPGVNSVDFYVYQTGTGTNPTGNPFGVLYAGEVSGLASSRIATPPAFALFGLAGLGLLARRRRTMRP